MMVGRLAPFRFWCQKVLPLVYDDSLSYYELLCKVVDYLNGIMGDVKELDEHIQLLEEYVRTYYNEKIQEAVDAKLDEMAADGTLDDLVIKNMNMGVNLFPFTKGSVVLDYKYAPSSYGKYNNTLYMLSFNRGGSGVQGDIGLVTEINLSTNQIVGNKERYLCHANGCCSVPERNCHYVVLAWMYDSDGSTHITVNGIAKYNNTFDTYTVIGSDNHYTGVSYDRVTGKVYAWDRPTNRIFEIDENDELRLLGYVQNPNVNVYNQGMAVNNGIGYISGYKGEFFKFRIDSFENIYYGNVMLIDGCRNYILDEVEDWEFNENGELMAVVYSKIRDVTSFGFYAQIGLADKRVKMPSSLIANPAFTADITGTSITKFDTSENVFKHPNEVYVSTHLFNTIQIRTDANFGNVVLGTDTVFNRGLVCDTLQVRCANVTFNPHYSSDVIRIGTINVANRGAKIAFGGISGSVYTVDDILIGNSRTLLVFGEGTVWPNNEFSGFKISSPVGSTFVVSDSTLIGPGFTRGFSQDVNLTVPAGGTATFSRTFKVPFDSSTTNWRFFPEYLPSSTPLVFSCSHSKSGLDYTAGITFYNPTASDVTLTTIRLNLFNQVTFAT